MINSAYTGVRNARDFSIFPTLLTNNDLLRNKRDILLQFKLVPLLYYVPAQSILSLNYLKHPMIWSREKIRNVLFDFSLGNECWKKRMPWKYSLIKPTPALTEAWSLVQCLFSENCLITMLYWLYWVAVHGPLSTHASQLHILLTVCSELAFVPGYIEMCRRGIQKEKAHVSLLSAMHRQWRPRSVCYLYY